MIPLLWEKQKKRAKLTRPATPIDPTVQIYSYRESSIASTSASIEPFQAHTELIQPDQQCSSSDFEPGTDAESSNAAGSTMADALVAGRYTPLIELDNATNQTASLPPIPRSKPEPLKVSSRALLKEYFAKAEPVDLLRDHSTLALTEAQIASVLRVVADEIARASYDMLESLVYRASRLNLNTSVPSKRVSRKSSVGSISQRSDQGESETDAGSDTSGAIRSCDDFESIGYAYEHSETELIATPPSSRPNLACGPNDPASLTLHFDADSPGSQTLAALQREAVGDQSVSRGRPGRRRTSTTRGRTRRPITRSCKIMKEAYFKGMEWTRTFVSGPVDPRSNPYKFYCQICKANTSIYGKGPEKFYDTTPLTNI